MTAALQTRNLTRRFGSTVAVDGIDLEVAAGEIYGFLGPNGAGKSTTVRMLTTLLLPSSGSAVVAGFDVGKQAEMVRLRIGVALQEAALDPKQTGRELLDLQGRLYGLTAADRRRRVDDLLVLVDIGQADRPADRDVLQWDAATSRPRRGAGTRARGAVPRRAHHRTRPVEQGSRVERGAPVERAARHDHLPHHPIPRGGRRVGRPSGHHRRGRIVAEGTPADLKHSVGSDVIIAKGQPGDAERIKQVLSSLPGLGAVDQAGDEVVVSVSNGAKAITPVAVALSEAGITIEGLTLRTPTLDDVFLHVTGERMGRERDDRLSVEAS